MGSSNFKGLCRIDIRGDSYKSGNIVDYSYNKKTVNLYNNPTPSTTYKFYGASSIYFSRTSNSYISIPTTSSDFNYGNGELTIDMVYLNNYSAGFANRRLYFCNPSSGYNGPIFISTRNDETYYGYYLCDSSGSIIFDRVNTGQIVNTVGVWSHVIIERRNDSIYCYQNGTLKMKDYIGSKSLYYSSSATLDFFSYSGYTYPTEGYLARLRVSKKARFYGNNYYINNR